MRIGVLALQGAFVEHINKLRALGIDAFEIRQIENFKKDCDGIVFPGGESTVMGKLLLELHLLNPIREAILDGLPVLGTCAGLILLSKTISNANQPGIGTMDIVCTRNGYGRQLGSFNTHSLFDGKEIPMIFIRAPYIQKVSEQVEVLSKIDEKIVAARQDNMLVTAFHPELTEDLTVYKYFMNMIKGRSKSTSV